MTEDERGARDGCADEQNKGATEPANDVAGVCSGDTSAPDEEAAKADAELDLGGTLDPLLTVLSRPQVHAPNSTQGASPLPAELLDQLAARVLRRCSVGRDSATTTVRLELGEGRFEGATVLVQSEQGRLSIKVEGEDRACCEQLEAALRARLSGRGVELALE